MTPSTHRHMATLCPLRLDTLRVPSAGIGHRRFRQGHGNALAAGFDIRASCETRDRPSFSLPEAAGRGTVSGRDAAFAGWQ